MSLVKPPSKLSCWACRKPIIGARTVIDGKWHCPDCAYRHDYPDKEIAPATKARRIPRQKETLFEVVPRSATKGAA